MTEFREAVRIITPGGELEGYLYVGDYGMPTLRVHSQGEFQPWSCPHAWRIDPVDPDDPGLLFDAWLMIEVVITQVADAQREAERETPEPDDDLTAAKRYKALEEER